MKYAIILSRINVFVAAIAAGVHLGWLCLSPSYKAAFFLTAMLLVIVTNIPGAIKDLP